MIIIILMYFIIIAIIIYGIVDIIYPLFIGKKPFTLFKKKEKEKINLSDKEKDIFNV